MDCSHLPQVCSRVDGCPFFYKEQLGRRQRQPAKYVRSEEKSFLPTQTHTFHSILGGCPRLTHNLAPMIFLFCRFSTRHWYASLLSVWSWKQEMTLVFSSTPACPSRADEPFRTGLCMFPETPHVVRQYDAAVNPLPISLRGERPKNVTRVFMATYGRAFVCPRRYTLAVSPLMSRAH